jgi:hypothetical protein
MGIRVEQIYGAQPVLYVTEVHEVNEPKALKAVEAAFDWSDLRIYDVNAPGLQHGVLLGTRRWLMSEPLRIARQAPTAK